MLGKSYFDLARAIYRATTFDDLVDLLVAKLPLLIGADEAVVLGLSSVSGVRSVSDHGPIAKTLREKTAVINEMTEKHPVSHLVDFSNPGDLGFAMSDYISPEKYRDSDWVKRVFGDKPMNDVLFGLLVSGRNRSAYLNCYIAAGGFGTQARERFDAILLTARGVLDRLEAHNIELSVRKRVFASSAKSPVAVFIVNVKSEICPLNHAAVSMAENLWPADEAVRQVSPDLATRFEAELDDAWDNPVTAKWKDLQLDLGSGEVTVQALPKLSGEIILLLPVAGVGGGTEEAMAILTRRQREIMDWIAEGKTSAEAAIILGISPRTVEKHLEAVFQRLGVENRIAAMRRYLDLQRGIA